jgi:hypothetical protein
VLSDLSKLQRLVATLHEPEQSSSSSSSSSPEAVLGLRVRLLQRADSLIQNLTAARQYVVSERSPLLWKWSQSSSSLIIVVIRNGHVEVVMVIILPHHRGDDYDSPPL